DGVNVDVTDNASLFAITDDSVFQLCDRKRKDRGKFYFDYGGAPTIQALISDRKFLSMWTTSYDFYAFLDQKSLLIVVEYIQCDGTLIRCAQIKKIGVQIIQNALMVPHVSCTNYLLIAIFED
ncbi:hypothetical protein M8C21_011814, partial [Ambrosia artemisiifolia]